MFRRTHVLALAVSALLVAGCQAPAAKTFQAAGGSRADTPLTAPAEADSDGQHPVVPHNMSPAEVGDRVHAYDMAAETAGYSAGPVVSDVVPDPVKRVAPKVRRGTPAEPAVTPVEPAPVRPISPLPVATTPVNRTTPDPNETAHVAALEAHVKAAPVLPGMPEVESTDVDRQPAAGSQDNLDSLQARLHRRVLTNPKDPVAQLDWDLYCLLNDEATNNGVAIAELPERQRELIAALMDGVSRFRSSMREETDPMLSREIDQLLQMDERFRSQAELDVPVAALCSQIDGFGDYTPIDAAHLPMGHETRAITYAQVNNFVPVQDDRQQWVTRLTQHLTLYSETGTSVWSIEAPTRPDRCGCRRRDIFVYAQVNFPASLPAGHYTLKVTVEDTNARKSTDAFIPLTIAAPVEVRPRTVDAEQHPFDILPSPTRTAPYSPGTQYVPATTVAPTAAQ